MLRADVGNSTRTCFLNLLFVVIFWCNVLKDLQNSICSLHSLIGYAKQ